MYVLVLFYMHVAPPKPRDAFFMNASMACWALIQYENDILSV